MSLLGSLFGTSHTKLAISKPMDLVTYAAGLSSNPAQIDPLLDTVRFISSSHQSGQPFTPQETAALLDVYKKIEDHLITKEPVRNFTKEGLRARLDPALRQQLEHNNNKE